MPLSKGVKTSNYTWILRLQLVALLVLSFFIIVVESSDMYNSRRDLIWTGGIIHNLWEFWTNNGNPWIVSFWAKPSEPAYSWWHLIIPEIGQQVLTWSFWVETIGWLNMDNIGFSLTDTGAGIWSLSGYAWSETAGWVDFSTARYQLSNTSFSWYAWNDMIWWIDMDGASLDMTSSGAIGKVKILWSYWGNRIFDTIYTLDGKIAPATVTRIINDVRRNIALLIRNVPSNRINSNIASWVFDHSDNSGEPRRLGDKLFFVNNGATSARVNYTPRIQERFINLSAYNPIYSVIAIGADIYIDDSVLPENDGKPRVIIATKNAAWVGGNIIIDWWVTRILSTLIAEWSIYSWEYNATWIQRLYNDNPWDLFKIPNRQLYVRGSMISNNTIGWYGTDNGVANTCPYNISPCDDRSALLYDFNHFRDFQKDLPEAQVATLRWYPNNTYDDYSLVIEHDTRILDSPPPGLEQID